MKLNLKLNLKSKRGQVSEALILLTAIALCTYSFYAVYSFHDQFSERLSIPSELVKVYQEQDNFEIYLKEAAKLAVNQASIKTLESKELCKIIATQNIPIWDSTCLSEGKFEDSFRKEIDFELKKMMNFTGNYKLNLGENIIFEFEPIILNISGGSYYGTYQYSPIFSVENPIKEKPLAIYSKIKDQMDECKEMAMFDLCINQMSLEDYELSCSSERYLICSLKTREPDFFNNSFEKMEVKFAIEI